ncbi:hypothetical protein [Rhizobium mongolense]|uniref:Uncharacterized protein n=2 Tax=Rhizobium mongolense TaxID=57676 RepID=A0ABR6IT22_9HYPH|nr:hypothetical protein [Rhizobium mongolense]MBB4231016.1 hypothetical protein [Rhizobium mongolense]TVZ66167.1 hypothetical protein BCL32_6522 [Rhizobium mongolense USDA 1844]
MNTSEVLVRRAQVVKVHLDALEQLLANPTPGISEAIRASISLRFLFDRALGQVAHELGYKITIRAPIVQNIPVGEALLFACGGYDLGLGVVKPHYAYREPGHTSPHRQQFERLMANSPSVHSFADVKLKAFEEQTCLAMLGLPVTRHSVIRYVANKCGGAHHHDNAADFEEIEMRLTQVGHSLRVNGTGLSAVFLETVGTASLLLASSSIDELRKALT